MSDISDTVDSHERRPPERAACHDDGEQVVGHDDRGDQAYRDTEAEGQGKALDLRRPDEAQDHAGDECRGVRVADGGPSAPDCSIDGGGDGATRPHLFFEAFEDQDVRVDGHAHREDEPGDAGKSHGDWNHLEEGQDHSGVKEQGDAREKPGHAVVQDHEDHHYRQTEKPGRDAELDRLRAERGTDLDDVKHLEVDWQRPGVDAGREVLSALLGEAAADHRLTTRDLGEGDRVGQELATDRVRRLSGQAGAVVRPGNLGDVIRVGPVVDVLLREVQPYGKVPLRTVPARTRASGDVSACQVGEETTATRCEADVDHPTHAVLVDGGGRALDVVSRQASESRSETRLRAVGYLVVLYPFRIDQLGNRADGLLRLVGGHAGEVDCDPVVVGASPTNFRLADAQSVHALVDHVDGPLLDVGARLSGRKVDQPVVDVRAAREVEASVDVELPATEVRRQAGDVTRQRVVVGYAVDIAGPVNKEGKGQHQDDEHTNGPAED